MMIASNFLKKQDERTIVMMMVLKNQDEMMTTMMKISTGIYSLMVMVMMQISSELKKIVFLRRKQQP